VFSVISFVALFPGIVLMAVITTPVQIRPVKVVPVIITSPVRVAIGVAIIVPAVVVPVDHHTR
jgi:hypothetical protein